jgi:magnesium transporter
LSPTALAISGIYGMNLKGLPFQESPYGAEWVAGITIVATLLLLYALRKLKWF